MLRNKSNSDPDFLEGAFRAVIGDATQTEHRIGTEARGERLDQRTWLTTRTSARREQFERGRAKRLDLERLPWG